ncbi:MAG: ABC transporter permease [Muribaculaceae bacterium]|nr:ABC transporter permease [Muribaculaceae bacterium]
MAILGSLIKKEVLHIVRDPRTMVITILMPVVLLLLFGFAISTEVNDVRIAAVVDRHTDETRNLLEKIRVNHYFTFLGLTSENEVEYLLRSGKADAILILRTDETRLKGEIVADASNPTNAQSVATYITGVINNGVSSSPVLTYTLYNPQMKSSYNFVPGIMGMIFILICAIMTSVSIVREKENGTMNLLLVSPIKPATIILGKLIPYFLLSCIILLIMMLISYTLLGLPVSVTIIDVVLVSLLYIVLSLSFGLLVSTIADSQLTALIGSAVILMLPVIMLSGMIFPIDNMPVFLQFISCVIPARWYIEAMRKLMIQQLDFSFIYQEIIILFSMTILLMSLSICKFYSSQKK